MSNDSLLLASDSEPSDAPLMEVNQSQAMTRAQQEVQGAVLLAKKFPRSEDDAFLKLQRSCQRSSFAEQTTYRFPRGRKQDPQTGEWKTNYVEGPSVDLAREAARCWGNIRYGFDVVSESKTERHIRAYAWDVEANTWVTQDAFFKKLIQRKTKVNGMEETVWVEPDERDLLELTNRHAAKAVRNCILQILPKDYIEDALRTASETRSKRDKADPDETRKALVLGFGKLNITPAMLEQYLGHPVAQCSPDELENLRGIWKSIKDGNSTWHEYVQQEEESQEVPPEMERIEEIVGLLSWTEARRRKFMAQYKGRMKEALEFLEAELNKDAGGAQ
jgi:hypothetical protein